MKKTWVVRPGGGEPADSVEQITQLLFWQRGVTARQTDAFLTPKFERDIHDPWLLQGMDRAIERVMAAVQKQERIVIYGDYDVDGLTATAMITSVLRSLGATVVPFIPHRLADGYGLNLAVLQKLAPEFDLLITVDCGVSNIEEITWLAQQHKEVIVIDHHEFAQSGQLPPALAVLHPRHPATTYPFPWLCGAGVTWKVCHALLQRVAPHHPEASKSLLDLVVLGTIADMVPLTGENRTIVHFGLQALPHTVRPGLRALLEKARLTSDTIDAETLAWRIIPRLNAAGKIDHAQPALDLLLTTDDSRARDLLRQLDLLNTTRQTETTRVMQEAEKSIDAGISPLIFVANLTWPAGVVGLVASRLSEKFARPAIVVGGNGQHAVGSARSAVAVNILEVVRHGQEHLLKFGGHARAAGFSVVADKLPALQATLHAFAQNLAPAAEAISYADACLTTHLMGWPLLHQLERFAPFGQGNQRPVFISQALRVVSQRAVGKTKQHAKFTFLNSSDEFLDGIGFGLADRVKPGTEYVDALFSLERNNYGHRQLLQLKLQDIAPTGTVTIQRSI